MNTPIAIGLAALVLACVLGDVLLYDGAGAVFMARETVDLIELIAFWR